MKTFTTYAEKKAKQFLNLLQGYTKGIRITAILILLLMGVSKAHAWGWVKYESTSPATIYPGDKVEIQMLLNGDANGATYKRFGYGTTNSKAGLTWSDNYNWIEPVGNDNRWKFYFIPTSATTYYWSLWIGWGSSVGDNGRYYKTGDWNEGSGSYQSASVTVNAVPKVKAFTATAQSTSSIALSWTKNSLNDDVLIVQGSSTAPTQGTSYSNGSTIGTGKVVYKGNATSTTITGLSASTSYTFYIYSIHNSKYYSASTSASATTKTPTYSYTVTAGAGGSVTPTSGTVAQGSGVTITATPNDGYEFDKWTATNGTLANANSASTTFTPSANNANATASFKVAGCTQTPTTPTSLTAKVEGNALPGAVCSGTNVTLTAGGSISVGSLQWGTGTVGENIIAAGNGCSSITVSPTVTTTYWVRSIITEAGDCYGETSEAKTLQINITPALVQPVLSKSTLTLEEGGSTGSITVTSGTTGGTWTSSDQNVATVNNGTVTPKGPGTATITYTVSNACEADKTATCTVTVNAKPYYIAGRLQQNWNTSSKTQQFTYVSNGQYKYETGKTVAELSAQWQDSGYKAYQYFFIHTGSGLSSSFTSSNNNGHNFHQKLGYANALTLSSNSEDKEAKYIKFADATDNSSDVVIWWEPSTNKLWYTATANYTVTYSSVPTAAADAPTTSPSVTSGNSVVAGTSVTFTAEDAKPGYAWKGWYDNSEGTGTALSTNKAYTRTINADTEIYAVYTEILSTITIIVSEGGSVKVDGGDFVSGNTVQVGVATTKKVTAVPNDGYGVAAWGVTNKDIVNISGANTVTLKSDGSGRTGTLYANFIGLEYTITFDKQEGTNGTDKATVRYKNNNYSVTPVIAPTRTGYIFGGYYTEANGAGVQVVSAAGQWLANATGYTDADKKWLVKENITLYAKWTAKTYTVTLDQEGAAVKGDASVRADYNDAMPELGKLPTAQNGYAFMGYWDGKDGTGTQYYNADGTSAHVWDKAEDATLYAHFVKAEITQITLDKYTFEPVEAGGTGFVTATPTIEPTPTNDVVLCWRLLYNNGNEVPGHSAQAISGNTVKFSIAGLAAGTYKIEAVLRTGSNCGSGDVLSTKTVNFTIASNYTITVKYTCDGKEIMTASKVSAHVTEETEITAPDITGYTFSSWEAGDGVTIKSTNGNSVKITAIYDGYLTAKYTARPMVYFKNTLGWEKVYVYTFSDNAWWDSGIQGVHPGANKLEQGEMTQIGESDIYYFVLNNTDGDYTQDNNANRNYIAFSNKDMSTYDAFYDAEAIYRGDHKNNLTLFIPQVDQTSSTTNQTKYYNKGIWMKYNSTESGYQMPTNNSVNDNPPGLGTDDGQGWSTYGNKFTAQKPGGYKFSITKHLEANKTYEFKIKNYVYVKDWENKDNNEWYGYNENLNTITDSKCTELHFHEESDQGHDCGNAKIKTTAEGEYTFTIDLSQGKVLLSVEYPVQVGDYRVIYNDNATWSHASAHDANWYHPSRVIKKNKTSEAKLDTISFFLHRETGSTYSMKFQKCTNINSAGKVTWTDDADIPNLKDKGESGVYNFIVEQTANGESISCTDNVERYTGNYYIRVDALAGKWDNYKTTPENRMTYSAFSESEANSFGDKYSHYATKYCDEGTNIKFVIANDYSPCISDTLAQDVKVNGANPFDNLDEHGTIKSDNQQNKANVRFMWNRKTNKISRVYIGSAAESGRHFLVLKSNKEMKDEDGNNLQNAGDNHAEHKAVFKDTQNWMYERTIKVQPGTRVKLYACYPMDNISLDAAEQKAQHFRGAYDGNTWDEENSIVILGGSGTDWNTIRVIYDFKTNRLMAALVPDQEVSGEKTIAADVMIIRKHQNPATSITLANDDSKMKEVKTVYGSLQLNRWVLNNRKSDKLGIEYCTEKINNQDTYSENVTNTHHPVLPTGEQKSIYERALYFISFPFDVHLSDVFGFGTYGTHWVISTYNGLRRAQRGYFAEDCINEDCTNWDYIWDPSNFTLQANQGYLLSLDLDLMRYDNTDFWLHNIDQVELFFPSTANLATIEKTSYTMPALGNEYQCKINLNTDGSAPDRDRRVKDSYWRCIGVPSFADYDGSLYKSEEDAKADKYPINWNTDYTWKADESGFPFLYEWNVTDNSLSVQNTSAYQFKPTFAYLVQNGGAIHWKAVNSKPSSVIARQRTETARNYEWKIALMRDGNQEDQTFVRITDNENVTTDFDFNQDLSKEFNYGRGDIYTLIGYERVAANSMPCSDKTTIIPLGLNIEQAGDYTIAMPEGVENIGITLVDNETGIHTNLSAGQEYTLTLNNGICENRLFIEVSPIQNTPTDLEYTTGDTREQTTRKVLINEKLYIIRDGVVYDAQGHRL